MRSNQTVPRGGVLQEKMGTGEPPWTQKVDPSGYLQIPKNIPEWVPKFMKYIPEKIPGPKIMTRMEPVSK